MDAKHLKSKRIYIIRRFLFIGISVTGILALATPILKTNAERTNENLVITANFTGREIASKERIELKLSRELHTGEGRFAVFIGSTDLTSLFVHEPNTLSYTPQIFLLPTGESKLTVYLVQPDVEWKALAEFPLQVKTAVASPPLEKPEQQTSTNTNEPTNAVPTDGDKPTSVENADNWKLEFTPNVALNFKGQNQTRTFPRESAPERNPFSEVDTQIGLEFKVSRRGWALGNKFDLVGVGQRQNALRFGELQNNAPMLDLSSYLIELSKDRFKVNLGHVSFGSNRHLINSFSSRGITATIPFGKQNEILLAAMNGTSIVGFDNFLGVSRRKHSILGAGFAREFFKERPNGLRVEFTVLRGSLLPLTNLNQGEINDAEKSLGLGFRVKGSNKKERLRYEAGITRSRFVNPADPLLEQAQTLTAISETWRTARFAEISFDILQEIEIWKAKKLKLTGTYRHEEIQPLYRSIGVSLQADKRQNQFEFSGSLGEMTFAFGNLRDRDNLNDIASILKTLSRRNNVVLGIPLGTFFSPSKPVKWLPQVSYTFEIVHQFGAFLPSEGEFRDASQVPDQKNFVHGFNAQWVLSDKINLGYRFSRAFQDNRQPGRERADFRSSVNAIAIGTKPHEDLDLDFELSNEANQNLEQVRTDRTFRIGTRMTWRTAFLKNSTFSGGLSLAAAGDTRNQNDARNAEFDVQWSYRFSFGKEKFKKLGSQFFIRYSNRYGSTIDRVIVVNGFNKTQAFNFGLSFNVF
ncbi:MAG: hypothetical protein ACRD6X_04280 [Pyrinomonadaceae bacterium]